MGFHNRDTVTSAQTAAVPVVDPAQMQNRLDSARRARLATGGSQSTFLSRSMSDTSTIDPAGTLKAV